MQEIQETGSIPGFGISLGVGNIFCSILAWKIPQTEEPGRLQFMRLQRVGHNSIHTQKLGEQFLWIRKQSKEINRL